MITIHSDWVGPSATNLLELKEIQLFNVGITAITFDPRSGPKLGPNRDQNRDQGGRTIPPPPAVKYRFIWLVQLFQFGLEKFFPRATIIYVHRPCLDTSPRVGLASSILHDGFSTYAFTAEN